jgi:hypothetical protein
MSDFATTGFKPKLLGLGFNETSQQLLLSLLIIPYKQ